MSGKPKKQISSFRLNAAADNTTPILSSSVFTHDDDDILDGQAQGLSRGFGGGASSRRHFAQRSGSDQRRSGPGTLPPLLGARKRPLDGPHQPYRDRAVEHGRLSYEDSAPSMTEAKFRKTDASADKYSIMDQAAKMAPKPRIVLAQLPPDFPDSDVKNLVPSTLKVDGIRVFPLLRSTHRKSKVAVVTLALDTPQSAISSAIRDLRKPYLGQGYYLLMQETLSTAAGNDETVLENFLSSSAQMQPFGAMKVDEAAPNYGRVPPPSAGQYASRQRYQVVVTVPSDLDKLRTIHQTIEQVVKYGAKYGVDFEAMLMSKEEVRKNEEWAWLFDARSPDGVYYRWRLWEIYSGFGIKEMAGRSGRPATLRIFDNGAEWVPPSRLPFEFATGIKDFVLDEAYASESSSSEDEDDAKKKVASDKLTYLNPYHKARLIYYLSRLPTNTASLRRGDIERVTRIALKYGYARQEIIDIIITNIETPFAWSRSKSKVAPATEVDANAPNDGEEVVKTTEAQPNQPKEDLMDIKIIALYVVHSIIGATGSGGGLSLYKYRIDFERALIERKIFKQLGLLEVEMGWGIWKTRVWNSRVENLFRKWDIMNYFSDEGLQTFQHEFCNRTLPKQEQDEAVKKEQEKKGDWSRFRKVNDKVAKGTVEEDIDGVPISDNDMDAKPIDEILETEDAVLRAACEPVDDEDDIDGIPMDEDDLDGEPIADENYESEDMEAGRSEDVPKLSGEAIETDKDMDMFAADSDAEAA